jgi:hypothetical protein
MNGSFSRDKRLPPRPSQDMGYGGGAQNGYGARNEREGNYGSISMSPTMVQEPPGRAVLDGYQADIMNGFEEETPRYNPVSV